MVASRTCGVLAVRPRSRVPTYARTLTATTEYDGGAPTGAESAVDRRPQNLI